MKFIFIAITLFSVAVHANSRSDIVKLLRDKSIVKTIGNADIKSITDIGNSKYEVVYGGCMLTAAIVLNCVGNSCVSEVKFSSADVNCTPPGSSVGN